MFPGPRSNISRNWWELNATDSLQVSLSHDGMAQFQLYLKDVIQIIKQSEMCGEILQLILLHSLRVIESASSLV